MKKATSKAATKIELTDQEKATIEAKRLEDKKAQEVATKIQEILTKSNMSLQVDPNSQLKALSIMIVPARQ